MYQLPTVLPWDSLSLEPSRMLHWYLYIASLSIDALFLYLQTSILPLVKVNGTLALSAIFVQSRSWLYPLICALWAIIMQSRPASLTKELLPLLEDELFRTVSQLGLLCSTDYKQLQLPAGSRHQILVEYVGMSLWLHLISWFEEHLLAVISLANASYIRAGNGAEQIPSKSTQMMTFWKLKCEECSKMWVLKV